MKKEESLRYHLSAIGYAMIILIMFQLSIPAYAHPQDKKGDKSAQSSTVSGHSILLNGIGLATNGTSSIRPTLKIGLGYRF